jgi:hypothetical protein
MKRRLNLLLVLCLLLEACSLLAEGHDLAGAHDLARGHDYVHFPEVGIYPAEGILNIKQGTVSVWGLFKSDHPRRDHAIFHTDDSRWVMYVDTYHSSSIDRDIVRIAARAGGQSRAVDSGYALGNFPETSIIIDNDGSLADYGAQTKWYSSVPYPEDEWHLVTMTWNGYPEGVVRIYLDERLIGEKPYDSRYDDGRSFANAIAIGFRPAHWRGEVIKNENGDVSEFVPNSLMLLEGGGIEIRDLRLYQRTLTQEEILQLLVSNGYQPD